MSEQHAHVEPEAAQTTSEAVHASADAAHAQTETQQDADTSADVRVVLVVFSAAVLLAMHVVSGFTFDF